MKIDQVYEAGQVKRFHTKRTIHTQNVAEHSWGVALILLQVCTPSSELMRAALLHDVAEIEMGDIPAPFKWDNTALTMPLAIAEAQIEKRLGVEVYLTAPEKALLKWADMMELIMYVKSEIDMGNAHLDDIYINGRRYIESSGHPSDNCKAHYERVVRAS